MIDNSIPYWMSFAHARNFSNQRKIDFLIQVVHDKATIENALNKMKKGDKSGFDFTEKEWSGILEAIEEIPNNAFIAEKLLDQGVTLINVMDTKNYPDTLKENLKKHAPIVIYAKGNISLLKKDSIAIVGSRTCTDKSINFTDAVAKKAVTRQEVIVSGFAKGIDKQALESALKYNGQSIIVLPQGIDTYSNNSYYSHIVKGDVLLLSTYHPRLPWSVGLAMDRNKTIYGLAKAIYVAESGDSGGTWEGVHDGLKRARKIYVRQAVPGEKNANNLLISMGASAVELTGELIESDKTLQISAYEPSESFQKATKTELSENNIGEKVVIELEQRNGKSITVNEIIDLLDIDKKLSSKINLLLSNHPELVKTKRGRENCYVLRSQQSKQTSIF